MSILSFLPEMLWIGIGLCGAMFVAVFLMTTDEDEERIGWKIGLISLMMLTFATLLSFLIM